MNDDRGSRFPVGPKLGAALAFLGLLAAVPLFFAGHLVAQNEYEMMGLVEPGETPPLDCDSTGGYPFLFLALCLALVACAAAWRCWREPGLAPVALVLLIGAAAIVLLLVINFPTYLEEGQRVIQHCDR